jgi:hypothetical protein
MFEVGQRVRIRETAFPGSDEWQDVEARGKVGTLIGWLAQADDGEKLWVWESDDGIRTSPFDSELELVEE